MRRKAPRRRPPAEGSLCRPRGTLVAAFERAGRWRSALNRLDIHNLVTLSRWPNSHRRQLWNEMVAPPGDHHPPTTKPATGEMAAIAWTGRLLCEIAIGSERAFHVHQSASARAYRGAPRRSEAGAWAPGNRCRAGRKVSSSPPSSARVRRSRRRLAVDAIFDADAGALIAVAGRLQCDGPRGAGAHPTRRPRGYRQCRARRAGPGGAGGGRGRARSSR